MFNRYFLQELSAIRETAAEFSRENPAIAPMLGEPSPDPDVERLLEGVAFLTGAVRQKIDDEFPEIIHDLIRQVWPHYLKPLPSSTIMEFTCQEGSLESSLIPKETCVDSTLVENTHCRFRTCFDTTVHPLSITSVSYEEPTGRLPRINLRIRLKGIQADNWNAGSIRFYLGGNYRDASYLYLMLINNVSRILVRDEPDTAAIPLDRAYLKPGGLSNEEALIPWPSNAFSGYRLLQEYFIFPEKFLFIELNGLETWTHRNPVSEFDVIIELKTPPRKPFGPDKKQFVLSATPAVNVFPHPAVPVVADHKKNEYRVSPSSENPSHYQVYSVEKVSGYLQGIGKEVAFKPFHSFLAGNQTYVYNEILKRSLVRNAMDVSVAIAYPEGINAPSLKTLSFDILSTNAFLPERLGPGDICVSTSSTPEGVTFRNIAKPTVAQLPPIGSMGLWKLTSMMTLNYVSLSSAENLRALLSLFLSEENRNKQAALANEKRISGIRDMEVDRVDRIVEGSMMRGIEIRLTLMRSYYAGIGDVYLFGTVLDAFFGLYASINTFTRLIINESDTGERFEWPERLGAQQLL